jgi:hypothetical protein
MKLPTHFFIRYCALLLPCLIALSHAQTPTPKVDRSVVLKESGRSVMMREIADTRLSES